MEEHYISGSPAAISLIMYNRSINATWGRWWVDELMGKYTQPLQPCKLKDDDVNAVKLQKEGECLQRKCWGFSFSSNSWILVKLQHWHYQLTFCGCFEKHCVRERDGRQSAPASVVQADWNRTTCPGIAGNKNIRFQVFFKVLFSTFCPFLCQICQPLCREGSI